jgi:hypothetical protein
MAMKRFARIFLAATFTTGFSSLAGAGQHHICYEAEKATTQSLPEAVWGCRDDAGGYCVIHTPQYGTSIGSAVPGHPPGTFGVFRFPSSGSSYTAQIDFYQAAGAPNGTRFCTVNTLGPYSGRGAATVGSTLVGFTSDASGLVTTGVWKLQSATIGSFHHSVNLEVPADFVAVGGGAVGQEWPLGALVRRSGRSDWIGSGSGNRGWTASTADLLVSDPHRTTAYAIGMRIQGMHARDLGPLIKVVNQNAASGVGLQPTSVATAPPPKVIGSFVALSGGVMATANTSNLIGQYVTVTAPTLPAPCIPGKKCIVSPITEWRVESTAHMGGTPGTVSTQMIGLPTSLLVGSVPFNVEWKYVSATSAVTAHPAVNVAGLDGYALTGIGASVFPLLSLPPAPPTPGNLIWKLEPRPDLLGASVASKDHVQSSPASITGYALGIKLVPQ